MSFLNKIFGGKKKEVGADSAAGLVESVLAELIRVSGLDLDFEVRDEEDEGVFVELSGPDEEMLTAKEGQLLDSIQLFVQRVLQHQRPDDRSNVEVDCAGYREKANSELLELADKLKDIALTKGKSVYFRALPPKDRKVVHQYLAEDGRVRSRSVGDGHFKKIKIYPTKDEAAVDDNAFNR